MQVQAPFRENYSISRTQESVFTQLTHKATSYDVFKETTFSNAFKSYLQFSSEYCKKLIKHHSKTFSIASNLLDEDRRKAIASLYAFCRTTDDIIDLGEEQRLEMIDGWLSLIHI